MSKLVHSKIAKFAYNFIGACILWSSAFSLMLIGLEGSDGMGLGIVMMFGGPVLLIVTPFVLWALQSLLSKIVNETWKTPTHMKLRIAFILLVAFVPLLLPAWYRTWYVPVITAIIMLVWAIPPVWASNKLKSKEKRY